MRAEARDRQTTAHRAAHFSHCSINKRFHIKGQCRTKALYCYCIVLFINKYGQKLESGNDPGGRSFFDGSCCLRDFVVAFRIFFSCTIFFLIVFVKKLLWQGIQNFTLLFRMHKFKIFID